MSPAYNMLERKLIAGDIFPSLPAPWGDDFSDLGLGDQWHTKLHMSLPIESEHHFYPNTLLVVSFAGGWVDNSSGVVLDTMAQHSTNTLPALRESLRQAIPSGQLFATQAVYFVPRSSSEGREIESLCEIGKVTADTPQLWSEHFAKLKLSEQMRLPLTDRLELEMPGDIAGPHGYTLVRFDDHMVPSEGASEAAQLRSWMSSRRSSLFSSDSSSGFASRPRSSIASRPISRSLSKPASIHASRPTSSHGDVDLLGSHVQAFGTVFFQAQGGSPSTEPCPPESAPKRRLRVAPATPQDSDTGGSEDAESVLVSQPPVQTRVSSLPSTSTRSNEASGPDLRAQVALMLRRQSAPESTDAHTPAPPARVNDCRAQVALMLREQSLFGSAEPHIRAAPTLAIPSAASERSEVVAPSSAPLSAPAPTSAPAP
eukprot:7385936-Prymnesium_polylepis.1